MFSNQQIRNITQRKNKKDRRKKNYKHTFDFKLSCLVNQLCEWIKRQRKILNINDMRCQLANKLFSDEEKDINVLEQEMDIQVKKYKNLVKIYQSQSQSKEKNQYLILQLDDCYFKKYWKQKNCLTLLFYQDQEAFFTDFKGVYHWYENYSHNIQIFQALKKSFIKIFEIGQSNLKPLLMKYTTDFLIIILEKFREFYYYLIEPTMNNSDCLLFVNCLLYNFLIGYVNHEIISNTYSLVYTQRIFGDKFQLDSIINIQRCHQISSQTWTSFDEILVVQRGILRQKVFKLLDYIFDSQLYKSALKRVDQSFYKDIKYNFRQNVYCILIQQLNIKGFVHKSGKIFINVYPVLRSFNIKTSYLFSILKAYCVIVTIIAVNQYQILSQFQDYLIDIIQPKILNINQPHLTLYKQLFGVKLENNNQSNLDTITYSLAMIMIKEIKKIQEIELLQQKIIQSSQNNQDPNYMFL